MLPDSVGSNEEFLDGGTRQILGGVAIDTSARQRLVGRARDEWSERRCFPDGDAIPRVMLDGEAGSTRVDHEP